MLILTTAHTQYKHRAVNDAQGNGCRYSGDFLSMAQQPLGGLGRLIFRGFTITLRHTTVGRTPLEE
jgi:hypothetical protein